MHILIAPNAFKNSLDAASAANAIRDGFMQSRLNCTCQCFPVGDGGDGTAALLTRHFDGKQIDVEISDPLLRKLKASFGLIDDGKTAIIEMADASGLRLLKKSEMNPLVASSRGTGEMIKAALDKGVKKVIIGMGGSSTVDAGSGILKALGVRFFDAAGYELVSLPADLTKLASINTQHFDSRMLNCEIIVLCDVKNLLLGEEGAAAVFGPQKGASPSVVQQLNVCLTKFAKLATAVTGKDVERVLRGGTAGGAAAGLYAFANAQLVNGIDYFLDITSFDAALAKTNLVITGEGSIDDQTLQGKAPYGVARRAKEKGLPVIAMAGTVPAKPGEDLLRLFDRLLSINEGIFDLETALPSTAKNLTRTAMNMGNLLTSEALY